ncbi:MAG: CHC2 zinc finger domain-containing protein [Methylobacter sp.]|nr:CHC2 zinc finger domain-containing protein [Methylobacter sp.]MDP2426970.1 CHC2 zinc finger domain-containing protein [Methylobacter sp.]MDP3056173.1 CHC2 zinc finger domain-containing protein [Methylobacter sp.]MDP3360620.1 CHC2 zinc finger domain-containing protein [Methylobacter sp.]MDZ4219559.1 CHC2 zinc finger domain-containing protein [Methylobacter sp.]
MSKIDNVLSKLDKVKANGSGKWLARCPAHEDKSPSLAIKQTEDGKILIHCFVGCHVSEVVGAVGLELSDLMPDNPAYKKGAKPPRFNKYELFNRVTYEATILSLAIRQLQGGGVLSPADCQRVKQAEYTINNIAKECRQ